jgi:hypothetical protein
MPSNSQYTRGSKHPVVAVNPDGTVAGYFESIKEETEKSGRSRHAISNSCRKKSICKGLQWYYEKDFRKIYEEQRMDDLKFSLNQHREKDSGHFCKGHKLIKSFQNWPKELQEKRRKISRELSKRLINDPNSNFGPNRKSPPGMSKKVIALSTGEVYYSVAECARKNGIGLSALHMSLRRMTRCGGEKYMLYSVYEEVNKRLKENKVI